MPDMKLLPEGWQADILDPYDFSIIVDNKSSSMCFQASVAMLYSGFSVKTQINTQQSSFEAPSSSESTLPCEVT